MGKIKMYKLKWAGKVDESTKEVQEKDNKIKFLREIVQGGADKSYGIEVARLAGLPKEILVNSKKILNILEERKNIIERNFGVEQMMLFGGSPEVNDTKEEILLLVTLWKMTLISKS